MKALFRTDASPEIGSGHVMRCLALAQAWRDMGRGAVFAAAGDLGTLRQRLAKEGFELRRVPAVMGSMEDAQHTAALAAETAAGWVVLDGYHFTDDFASQLQEHRLRVLVIDDYGHADHRRADLVLNQNIHATPELYARRGAATRLLLGTRYALLRREFWPWRGVCREVAREARRVLVTFGGSDPLNVTGKVLRVLGHLSPDLAVKVVIGGANPHAAELAAQIRALPQEVEIVVDTEDMPGLMAWADVAITAGASTSWELLLLGVPQILIPYADNQIPVAEGLGAQEVAVYLGRHPEVTEEQIASALQALIEDTSRRAAMVVKGGALVDGWGGVRVATAIAEASLRLRPAREEDARLLWQWATDPAVRASAFSTAPIPWETHLTWLSDKLRNPDCVILLAMDEEEEPVGQIRFDFTAEGTEIDVSVASAARGKGWGAALIGAGVHYVRSHRSEPPPFHAYVKPENLPSLSAFVRAGFARNGDVVRGGTRAVHLTLAA